MLLLKISIIQPLLRVLLFSLKRRRRGTNRIHYKVISLITRVISRLQSYYTHAFLSRLQPNSCLLIRHVVFRNGKRAARFLYHNTFVAFPKYMYNTYVHFWVGFIEITWKKICTSQVMFFSYARWCYYGVSLWGCNSILH